MFKNLKARYKSNETEIYKTTTYVLGVALALTACGYTFRGEVINQIEKAVDDMGLATKLAEHMNANGPF